MMMMMMVYCLLLLLSMILIGEDDDDYATEYHICYPLLSFVVFKNQFLPHQMYLILCS